VRDGLARASLFRDLIRVEIVPVSGRSGKRTKRGPDSVIEPEVQYNQYSASAVRREVGRLRVRVDSLRVPNRVCYGNTRIISARAASRAELQSFLSQTHVPGIACRKAGIFQQQQGSVPYFPSSK